MDGWMDRNASAKLVSFNLCVCILLTNDSELQKRFIIPLKLLVFSSTKITKQ